MATAVTRTRVVTVLIHVTLLAAIIAGWEAASSSGLIDSFFYGAPSGVAALLSGWIADGTLFTNIAATVSVVLVGWVLATVLGTAIALVLARLPTVRAVAAPFLAFLNGTPRIVFYPFFAIWLGFEAPSKIALIVYVVIVLVIMTVLAGMDEVPLELVNHVRVTGGRRRDLVVHVYVPSIALWILSSARLTIGFALQAAIVSEFVGPAVGLGHLAVLGQNLTTVNIVWAALATMIFVALALDVVLSMVERRVTRWQVA
jgi:ABC-type nitrate/sulfonate/bicarbonate transport system permease component